MMSNGTDKEQRVVKTYVSAYQKERWREHADELEMSQSEFIRTMTQAGRRGFDFGSNDTRRMDSEDETPGVDDLEDRVLNILDNGYCSWDKLVESLTEDLEDRLEVTLQRLQRKNRIQYSGRHGGYTVEDTNGD